MAGKARESAARPGRGLGGQVSTGGLCTPSQLQAQVATLSWEVTQLQRQRERSLEKESSRVKVLSSNLQPPKGHFPPPDPTQGPRFQACVPAVEWAMASQAPALTPLRVLRLSTLPLRPTARDRLRAGLRRLSCGRRWPPCVCSWSRPAATGELGSWWWGAGPAPNVGVTEASSPLQAQWKGGGPLPAAGREPAAEPRAGAGQ